MNLGKQMMAAAFVKWDSVRGFAPRPGVPGSVCAHLREVTPGLARAGPRAAP